MLGFEFFHELDLSILDSGQRLKVLVNLFLGDRGDGNSTRSVANLEIALPQYHRGRL